MSPYLGPVKSLRAADRTQETGTRFLLVQRLVKGMNEQPNEKIPRRGSGRVLNIGAPVPVELAVHQPLTHGCVLVHQRGSAPNPILGGSLWKLHHVGTIHH